MKFPPHFVYDRVYVIGFDGGGNFFRNTPTPNIDRVFEGGSVTHFARTTVPTLSGQCWSSILHGVSPVLHRLSNDRCSEEELTSDFPYPSVFRVARRQYPDAVLASFNNWNAINHGIVENDIGVIKGHGTDDEITDKICECIEKDDPKLLFVQFDLPDECGGYGFGSPYQLGLITHCDALFGRIYDTAERKGITENLLVILTADHGGRPDGNHGDDSDAEKYVSYFVRGKTVICGTPADVETLDTASVVAFALGCTQPDIWSSRVPEGMFSDAPSFPRRAEVTADTPSRFAGRENLPAPGNISRFADTDGIVCFLPFENTAEDITGKTATKIHGVISYTDGYYGRGAALDGCSIALDCADFGKGSFSLFSWIKNSGVGKKTLFEMKSGSGTDFGVYIGDREIIMKIACLGETNFYKSAMPVNSDGVFIPFIVSFDRACNELCTYYDFYLDRDRYCVQTLPDDADFTGGSVTVGGGSGLTADDFIIFGHKLSDAEIDRLMDYYMQ